MRMKRHFCAGFAMMDLLIAGAVLALVLAAAVPLLTSAADEMSAKGLADEMKAFQDAAVAHYIANRDAYDAAMTTGTNASTYCRIGADTSGAGGTTAVDLTLHTCAVDAAWLRYNRVLPTTFREKNSYGEQWVAIHKQVYNGATATGGVETLVVSAAVTSGGGAVAADSRRYQLAQSAAGAAGGAGGVVPETNRGTCKADTSTGTYEVCGDGWKVNLWDFITSANMTTYAARLP